MVTDIIMFSEYKTHSFVFLMDMSPERLFRMGVIITITVIAMMRTVTTTPPIMAAVLSEELCELVEAVVSLLGAIPLLVELPVVVMLPLVVGSVVGVCIVEHSSSLRDEIATEHSESMVNTPVMMTLALPFTHSSNREMSEPLSVSKVPPSLARYVTCVGDSG